MHTLTPALAEIQSLLNFFANGTEKNIKEREKRAEKEKNGYVIYNVLCVAAAAACRLLCAAVEK